MHAVCEKTKGCRAFVYEKANPRCAYLKSAGGVKDLKPRKGWVVVSYDVYPPPPKMCKGCH